MVRVLIAFAILLGCIPARAAEAPDFIESVERAALAYFLENTHSRTGLARDQAPNFPGVPHGSMGDVASSASTGFGLAVVANGALKGYVSKSVAYRYCLRSLRFAKHSAPKRNGWLLHFMDWSTGERIWNSEYSTIDTALFIAGALYAGSVFEGSEVQTLAHELYRGLDFHEYLTDGGARPGKLTLSMGYLPESGYIPAQWDMYAEQKLLLILGLGHPSRPLPVKSWRAWRRNSYRGLMGLGEALFVHQYSESFIDFRAFADGYPNYHRNSAEITRVHRALAAPDAKYRTLREGFWGFSAGLAPRAEYHVYSALGYRGTVCIGCALASAQFSPEIIGDFKNWRTGRYAHKIWGRYGFVDSVDLDQNWFARSAIGITIGPGYMGFANTARTNTIWSRFMSIPAIRAGLARAAQSK